MTIPLTSPYCSDGGLQYVAEAIRSRHLHYGGPFARRCESLLRAAIGSPAIFLTSSCTSALEFSAQVLAIQGGDEVIVPAYSFVSTVSAYQAYGARVAFCDVEPGTLNIDATRLESALTARTR